MDSIFPKSKTGKSLTYGGSLLLILGYLAELRASVGQIEVKVAAIEQRFANIDQAEHLKKLLINTNRTGE